MILFDIGCNHGNYTLANLNKYTKIICVDASYIQTEILSKRVPLDKCEIMNAIVSKDKNVNFYICSDHGISTASLEWKEGKGRFAPGHHQYNPHATWELKEGIQCVTIDELVEKYGVPSFIKIDVEGYEDNVIKSMSRAYCPIAFEFSEEMKIEHLNTLEYLENLGYDSFFIQYEDTYDFVPDMNTLISYEHLVHTIHNEFNPDRKEIWGMIWCFQKTHHPIHEVSY